MVSSDSLSLAPAVSHQRKIRDAMMSKYPRPVMTSLEECHVALLVGRKNKASVEKLILQYEWLGTLPKVPKRLKVGLFSPDDELIGAAMFGHGHGTLAKLICGKEHADKAICLERGAGAHWAPKNAASFMIAKVCNWYGKYGPYRIFYAYADPSADEIGQIYQAANWVYIGQGPYTAKKTGKVHYRKYNKEYLPPKDNSCGQPHKLLSERSERRLRNKHCQHTITDHKAMGWKESKVPTKHKYVYFAGSKTEKKKLIAALKYPVLPYPKRQPPAPSG